MRRENLFSLFNLFSLIFYFILLYFIFFEAEPKVVDEIV